MIEMFNRNANGVRAIKSSLPSARTPLALRLNENISLWAARGISMEAEFLERPPRIVAEACDRIERLTGGRRRPTQVRQFLRTTRGLKWRKVAAIPVPLQQSVAEQAATQAAFLKDGAGTATG